MKKFVIFAQLLIKKLSEYDKQKKLFEERGSTDRRNSPRRKEFVR